MAPAPKCNITVDTNLTDYAWLDQICLEKAVQTKVGNTFHKLLNIEIINASAVGENYSSLLMRLKAEVELNDTNRIITTFILKAPQSNIMIAQMLDMFGIFPKEDEMYHKILPKFEQLYTDVGKDIRFSPKAYKFDVDINKDYILLEDLLPRKYKNANRFEGLDISHTLEVLKKMAEYHAASACYIERYGSFSEDFTTGIFCEKNRHILQKFNNSCAFLSQLRKWSNCGNYYEKLADSDEYLVDRLLEDQRVNAGEFNVLNHGDCWVNNIMFQYDGFNKIKNVLFVDFALAKYGSPANDLYYFILSSVKHDLKLQQFDYFIRYYYNHLVDNLKLLQYGRPLPKLTNIHGSLLKNGLAAYMIVSKVLPAVILDKTDDANLENYIGEKSKMVNAMFNNPKYVKEMKQILPWLNNRGLLDWKQILV